MKSLGPAASANEDLMDKSDVTAAINAADGTGLTDNGSGVLSVGADYRSFPVVVYLTGTVTTGTKTPEFIAPVACTVVSMLGRCNSGSGAVYRPSKNAGTADGTASASTGTSVVTTSQSLSLAAGDRLALRVTTAGGTDLSVTFWVRVD